MPIEQDPPRFDANAPIRAPDLNRLGEMIAYLARYFGDRLPEVISDSPGITQPPIECFPALVKTAASLASSGVSEPTNATYYLQPCIAKLGLTSTDQFDAQADDFPGPSYVVGTNLAEVTAHGVSGTHTLLTDGTVQVLVFALPYRENPLKKQYVFYSGGSGATQVYRMKITDPAFATGVIKAQTWDGTTMGGTDLQVASWYAHANGDEIVAVKPQGGTAGSSTVLYAEVFLTAGTSQYQVLQMTSGVKYGWDWVRAHA